MKTRITAQEMKKVAESKTLDLSIVLERIEKAAHDGNFEIVLNREENISESNTDTLKENGFGCQFVRLPYSREQAWHIYW